MRLFLFLILFSVQVFARPEISLPAEVEVSQRERLTLGDVAVVTEGTEKMLLALDRIVIREDARELLLSQYLYSQEVMSKIRSVVGSDTELKALNPKIKIPSKIKVSFASTPVSRQEVERKIHNVLKARCHECEYNISIQSTPAPSSKGWDLDYSQLTGRGGFLLPLRDGSRNQIKWISGTIRVSQLTPVTTRLILQGERVQSEDLKMVLTDTTYAKDGVLRLEDITGQLAARSLPVGSPIWTSDLKREPAAKKGQVVKALLGDDTFEISVNMQAEENGFVGDIIKVRNLENKKILSGVVTEKGVVKVQ